MENNERYQEYKNKLAEVYTELVTEKPYLLELKTCIERDFYDILMKLEDAWYDLAVKGNDYEGHSKEKNSFEYRLYEWTNWMHNFNQRTLYTLLNFGQKPAKPFDVPEFIEYLVEQTGFFLDAETREEELHVLDRRPYIVTILEKDSKLPPCFEEQIWLTSEDVGIESENLPYYFPKDVSKYLSFEDLKQRYTKGKKEEEWSMFTKFCVEDWEWFWNVVNAAKKKGLIKDREDR